MSSALTLQDLREFSQKLMKKEGFDQYDLEIEGHSGKGENYLGEVTFFTLTTKKSGKIYNLVMKTAKRSEAMREKIPVGILYRRELYSYCQVFPTFRKFLQEFKLNENQFDYIPKIYWVCEEENRETLIMENMIQQGYKILNRMEPMGIEDAIFVLQTLGKHHAISLAMKKLRPEVVENLKRNLSCIYIEIAKIMKLDELWEGLIANVLKLLENEGRNDLVEKFKNYKDDIVSILKEIPSEDKLVICHGDCWINNIMFKKEDNKICFIDYQLSMLDNPIKDLSYFIYTASDKKNLDNFDLLLEKYYISLSTTLKMFGLESKDFFTIQTLKNQWKNYGKFGLILSTMDIKFELFHSDEAPDISDGDFNPMELIDVKMKNEEIYNKRMIDLYTHFGETFL